MAYFALAAGHGASDPGAVNGTRLEKDDNLKLCLKVGKLLEDRGHRVDYYRTGDTECTAANCREWMKAKKADFALCFHRNSFSNITATGAEVWSFSDELSVSLATKISAAISSSSGLYNRGRKGNGAAWLSADVPCAQPEVGFISNPADNVKFDNTLDKIAEAIANELENVFGPIKNLERIAVGTTTDPLNLRVGPSTASASLGIIPQGGKIDIYSVEKNWVRVSYNGKLGYSSADYIKIDYFSKPSEEITIKIPDIKIPKTATEETVFQIIGRSVRDLIDTVFSGWKGN